MADVAQRTGIKHFFTQLNKAMGCYADSERTLDVCLSCGVSLEITALLCNMS